MCQAYEGERAYVVSKEITEIRQQWADHKSGKCLLTDEQIKELVVRKMMLDEQ